MELKELRGAKGAPSWFGQVFFGRKDGFNSKLFATIAEIQPNWKVGIYTGDNLFTFGKNLSFLTDVKFMAAIAAHTETNVERSTIWRAAVLCWAGRLGLRHPGDFVECGCYRGTSARVVYDVLSLHDHPDRQFWLYDLFDYPEGSRHTKMPGMRPELFEETRARFADLENVRVSKGSVPEVLTDNAPSRIAFLHIDMNNVKAEIGALDALFDRVEPGAPIVLDDYGYFGYVAQRDAERAWFAERGYDVLELPTSQGLVIK